MVEVDFVATIGKENKVIATATLANLPREGEYITFHSDGRKPTYRVTQIEWVMNSRGRSDVKLLVFVTYSSGQ